MILALKLFEIQIVDAKLNTNAGDAININQDKFLTVNKILRQKLNDRLFKIQNTQEFKFT